MRPSRAIPARRAFTIVELMIVVAVIAVLVSILLVAFGGARRTAQQASASRFVATIGQAVEAFERELGYLPPLLMYDLALADQPLLGNPTPSNARATTIVPESKWGNTPSDLRTALAKTRYASEYSLAVYLLGTGDIDGDEIASNIAGANSNEDDGQAGPGFRDPGPDRSWGGAADRQRQRDSRTAAKLGRTFGPFLDMAGLGDKLLLDQNTGLFKLLDTWGQPVRYYKDWPTKNRPATPPPEPSIEFTPIELRTADALEAHLTSGDPDLAFEAPALNSRFTILSAGEPFLFGARDVPIPLFGDRNRTVTTTLTLEALPSNQNLEAPFDVAPFITSPGQLNVRGENLLQDLKSNVRYTP